jgi:hypothetical protein
MLSKKEAIMQNTSINPASFLGGNKGAWKVKRIDTLAGAPLSPVPCVGVHLSHTPPTGEDSAAWVLRGTNTHVRYSERKEVDDLAIRQPALNRPEATYAALIPIRKSAEWWQMSQDERRKIFEEESQHIAMSMQYLPAIARRLYHCRELGEPFDFLTWFEFAPKHESLFNELVSKLRDTKEWKFVDREIDIRLVHND